MFIITNCNSLQTLVKVQVKYNILVPEIFLKFKILNVVQIWLNLKLSLLASLFFSILQPV